MYIYTQSTYSSELKPKPESVIKDILSSFA